MADPMSNNSDKIMVRKPDGSFEVVTIERDAQVPKNPTIQPNQKKKDEENKLIQSKDFYKKEELERKQQEEVKKPVQEPKPTPKPKATPVQTKEEGTFSWEGAVEEVINSLADDIKNPSGKDESYDGKLKNIILSRLRDVRDWLATKEALTKDIESGGLSLNEAQAAVVLNIIEAQFKKIHSQPIPKVAETPSPFGSDVTDLYKPQETIDALVEADVPVGHIGNYQDMLADYVGKGKNEVKVEPQKISEVPQPKIEKTKEVIKPEIKNEPARPTVPTPKPTPVPTPTPPPVTPPEQSAQESPVPKPVRQQPQTPTKPSLTDVKPKKRLVGPVDELKTMTLPNFRRLASNTTERLARVDEIILGLEEESFAKKVEGIKGWRQSPLYKKYVNIGNQSLTKSMSIEEVIASLGQASDDEFTLEEFNMITDFNRKLRY